MENISQMKGTMKMFDLQHCGTQVIETEQLILRPYTVCNAEDMYRNWARP